jgi:ABC-type transport system involved in multi-copper enzyme maturation permease subunit
MKYLSPRWLVGPILDKELRVSSRRRRNYVVRMMYLVLLILFLTLVWLSTVPTRESGAYRTTEMARAGQTITQFIVWFQFLACQVLAIVMLSTAISDEVYHRTLGVLMTTPINSLQIVVGKLVSRLFQVLLLMAVSLPLLAIVRIFGGIAWSFLAGSWILTFTTTLFVGSVSLLFSIFCRRAYGVILWTALSLFGLWGGIPLLSGLVGIEYHFISERQWLAFFSRTNPFFGLAQLSEWFMSPRTLPLGVLQMWLGPSLVLVMGTIGLLTIAVIRVRIVARRQITGDVPVSRGRSKVGRSDGASIQCIPVRGCPILWKEMRAPLMGKRKGLKVLVAALVLGGLAVLYGVAAKVNALDDSGFHIPMVFLFMIVGGLFSIVIPATTITTEKETRSWPILLGTTLSDWRIVLAKGLGAIRRTLPAWFFLVGHVLGFTIAGLIHPLALLQLAMSATGLVAFVSGTGLYFSSRFRHTTMAVIANLAVPVVLWILVPIVIGFILAINGSHNAESLMTYLGLCPFVQAGVITETCVPGWRLQMYRFGSFSLDTGEAMVFLLVTMTLYILLGFVFARRARCNLRRRIF